MRGRDGCGVVASELEICAHEVEGQFFGLLDRAGAVEVGLLHRDHGLALAAKREVAAADVLARRVGALLLSGRSAREVLESACVLGDVVGGARVAAYAEVVAAHLGPALVLALAVHAARRALRVLELVEVRGREDGAVAAH